MSTSYPSNLSDAEWKCLQRYLPPQPKRGWAPIHSLRVILDAIFSVLRTGCPWRYLPAKFPPWQTVFSHFRRMRIEGTWTRLLRALHRAEREDKAGILTQVPPAWILKARKRLRNPQESAVLMLINTSRAASTTSSWIRWASPFPTTLTPADTHDTRGACCLLAGLKFFVLCLKKIWADSAYRGQELASLLSSDK